MISIIIPSGFFEERAYACHVLFNELLGIKYQLGIGENAEGYRIEFGEKKIRIKDAFFNKHISESTYIAKENIPGTATQAGSSGLEDVVIIHGTDHFLENSDGIDCGVDLIAGTFFMLSRWEEAVSDERDSHGRFPGVASLAYRSGFLNRPVVDEYSALLKKWLIRIGVPADAFKAHEYRLSLQCDVDAALYWPSPASFIRKAGVRLIKQRSPGGALYEIGRYLGYLRHGHDPYDTFDQIMDLAERCNSKATFFFPVGGTHAFDNRQLLQDKHVFNFFAHVAMRGHETGVHFSYLTADDSQLMLQEAEVFKDASRAEVLLNRQHYLRCTIPDTWRGWGKAGVTYDFTMGYPDAAGFRCGICHQFPLFDIHEQRMLNVYERPLVAMDVTFRMYLESTPEETIEICRSLMETVQKHQGEFVLLWHNSSFAVDWEGWENVVDRLMANRLRQASAVKEG